MIETPTLGVFAAAAFLLLMTPGPAVLYIVTRSVEQGRRAGLISVLGICTGTLAHVAAAALGISALLVASPRAFSVLRYLGAAYLIVLGLRTLSKRETAADAVGYPRPPGAHLRAGRDRQPAESPHGALLLRVSPAVRRSVEGRGAAADRDARAALHPDVGDDRCRLGDRRRHRGRLDPAEPEIRTGPAIRHRRRADRAGCRRGGFRRTR